MKIHTKINREKRFFITPAIFWGQNREYLSHYRIGVTKHISLAWLFWEVQLFTCKMLPIRPDGLDDADYFRRIAKECRTLGLD